MLIGSNKNKSKDKLQEECVPMLWCIFIAAILGFYCILNFHLFASINILRYIIYLVPFISITIYLLHPNCRDNTKNDQRKFVWLMMLSFVIPIFLAPIEYYKYFGLMWLGFLPFAFPLRFPKKYFILLFFVFVSGQVFTSCFSGFSFKGFGQYGFASGSSSLTHTLPVVFSLFLFPLYKEKKYALALLCLLMIPIAGKRSVILASFFGILIQVLGDFFTKNKQGEYNARRTVFFILALYVFGLTVSLNMPRIYEIIAAYYNLNIDIMSSGRYVGQSLAYDSIYNGDAVSLLFGQGLGKSDEYGGIAWGYPVILHNDYLRILIDFGIINGFIFLLCFFRLVGKNRFGFYLIGVSAVSWETENPMISVFVALLYFYLTSTMTKEKNANALLIKKL